MPEFVLEILNEAPLALELTGGPALALELLPGLGPRGAAGGDGAEGLSAYEVWLDAGHTGSETDFLTWLKGPAGDPGADGTPGAAGAAGASAYQLWLAAGHAGTEADFLDWLQGAQGPAGADGAAGVGVPAGGTTGQVLSKIDGTNYNTQWSTPGGAVVQFIQHFMPLAAGTLIDAAVNALSQTTQAGAVNRCDFVPFRPSRDITVSTMRGEVTTGLASSNFILGIYDDNNGQPGNKLIESAVLSGVTVQNVSHAIPGGFTFQAGVQYWLAFLSSSTTTFRALAIGGMHSIGLGASGSHCNIRRGTAVSFALPATAMSTALTSAQTPQMSFAVA